MNILIPDSWLREFLHTNATPADIQRCLSLCGPSVERMHEKNGEYVYDIEVTTNRVDCMSVLGIAREAIAILPQFGFDAKLTNNPFDSKKNPQTKTEVSYLTVSLDPILCPNFSAALIKDVTVSSSPDWLIKKLELVDMRPINIVVDVSNYLMHMYGQPVHVFDYDKIGKHIMKLRESKQGETVTTLDNKTYTLPGHDIVIEDGNKQIIDLSGIMGGLNSSVNDQTQNVLLYVQTYEPTHIRKTSMSLSARTVAASLFEKDLPQKSVLPTLMHGISLLKELTGGTPEKDILSLATEQSSDYTVEFTQPITKFTNLLLGVELSKNQIKSILTNLDFNLLSETKIAAPWYRYNDIRIPQDIVEEIARIYGYHNLPAKLMSGDMPNKRDDKKFATISKIKTALKYLGFTETYTYSLVASDSGLKLKNPLTSDWEYLRTSLTPSHIQVISENLGRVGEINLFEIANVYLPNTPHLPIEQPHLILSSTNPDLLRLKGVVQALLADIGITDLIPEITRHDNICLFEIDLDSILDRTILSKTYSPISKFAPIIEDINIKLTQPYPQLLKKIFSVSPYVWDVLCIDHYEDKITVQIKFHSNDKQLNTDDIAPLRTTLSNLG